MLFENEAEPHDNDADYPVIASMVSLGHIAVNPDILFLLYGTRWRPFYAEGALDRDMDSYIDATLAEFSAEDRYIMETEVGGILQQITTLNVRRTNEA